MQEMNSIELGAFCSDFPKDWVKNHQQQQQKKAHPSDQPEKFVNPEDHHLCSGGIHTSASCFEHMKTKTCCEMLQFWTKRLQRLPGL